MGERERERGEAESETGRGERKQREREGDGESEIDRGSRGREIAHEKIPGENTAIVIHFVLS